MALLYFKTYRFYCPLCGKAYARSVSPLLLGKGRRKCPKCGGVFNDGAREWWELTRMQGFEYVFPATVLGYLGGVVVVVAFIWSTDWSPREKLFMSEMIALLMVMPWAPYFIGLAKRVRESVARLGRHKVFGDTDEFILSA